MAGLLAPLPLEAAGAVIDIARVVPEALAAPVLQHCMQQDCASDISELAAKEILWKLRHYLGSLYHSATTMQLELQPDLNYLILM